MNISSCANCLLHGWKQVEDLTTLQRCKRCKVIQYCGIECQREHWNKVHHKQCKYFADPVKAQRWDHSEKECGICRQSAVVGQSQLKRPDNPHYECIFEEVKKDPPHMYHPHPFPVTGDPGDIYEKVIIVLWQLMKKFQLTQPGVDRNCREELGEVFSHFKTNRLFIWRFRKISPQSQMQRSEILPVDLFATIVEKVERSELRADPFKLWNIILLVGKMSLDVYISENLSVLINPLADMPAELHAAVSQGISNSVKFLATAQQVLDALATQVIPYRDVLSIICGGSLEQSCTFCSKKIIITNVNFLGPKGPVVRFTCLSTGIYSCEGYNCLEKLKKTREDYIRFEVSVLTAVKERGSIRCDFCLKLPPSAEVHRCSKCLAVMYCGTACRDQDLKIHKEFCKEGVEQRKKKFGGSARRREARETLDDIQKGFEGGNIQEACEVIGKFKLNNSTKKSHK